MDELDGDAARLTSGAVAGVGGGGMWAWPNEGECGVTTYDELRAASADSVGELRSRSE